MLVRSTSRSFFLMSVCFSPRIVSRSESFLVYRHVFRASTAFVQRPTPDTRHSTPHTSHLTRAVIDCSVIRFGDSAPSRCLRPSSPSSLPLAFNNIYVLRLVFGVRYIVLQQSSSGPCLICTSNRSVFRFCAFDIYVSDTGTSYTGVFGLCIFSNNLC